MSTMHCNPSSKSAIFVTKPETTFLEGRGPGFRAFEMIQAIIGLWKRRELLDHYEVKALEVLSNKPTVRLFSAIMLQKVCCRKTRLL